MEPFAILLVDDEAQILRALQRELMYWAKPHGLRFLSAASGEEALTVLEEKSEEVMLVISDLKMPGMKGSDLLLEVKKRHPHIISILLTGFSEGEELMKSVAAGIHSFILKPWETSYLIAELEKARETFMLRRERDKYLAALEQQQLLAGEMQRHILEFELPLSEMVEFSHFFKPVTGLHCGGDYTDILDLGEDRYLLLLGDVSGHGVQSALVTAMYKSVIYGRYLRKLKPEDTEPAAFLFWLNNRSLELLRNIPHVIVPFSVVRLDAAARECSFANAGHMPIYHINGGICRKHHIPEPATGFTADFIYTSETIRVHRGDRLVLFTDGLMEFGRQHEQIPEKLLEEVFLLADKEEDFASAVVEELVRLSGTETNADDFTIVSIRFR